jgi:hypothetical protein
VWRSPMAEIQVSKWGPPVQGMNHTYWAQELNRLQHLPTGGPSVLVKVYTPTLKEPGYHSVGTPRGGVFWEMQPSYTDLSAWYLI